MIRESAKVVDPRDAWSYKFKIFILTSTPGIDPGTKVQVHNHYTTIPENIHLLFVSYHFICPQKWVNIVGCPVEFMLDSCIFVLLVVVNEQYHFCSISVRGDTFMTSAQIAKIWTPVRNLLADMRTYFWFFSSLSEKGLGTSSKDILTRRLGDTIHDLYVVILNLLVQIIEVISKVCLILYEIPFEIYFNDTK